MKVARKRGRGRPKKSSEEKLATGRARQKKWYDAHEKVKTKIPVLQTRDTFNEAVDSMVSQPVFSCPFPVCSWVGVRSALLKHVSNVHKLAFLVLQPLKVIRNPTQRMSGSGVVRCFLEGLVEDGLHIEFGARILDATGPASTMSKPNNIEVILTRGYGCSVWCNDLNLPPTQTMTRPTSWLWVAFIQLPSEPMANFRTLFLRVHMGSFATSQI